MRFRIVLITAGVLLMGYAVAGALTTPDVAPAGVLLFLAGVLAGHDVVWMAAALACGAAIARFVPHRHRPVARAAAVSVAAVTFVAAPFVLGPGRPADNPSVLPLPYGRNLAAVLLVITGAALVTCLRPVRPSHSPSDRKKSTRPGEGGP